MKIAFSEYSPNYGEYIFPYHVWGYLENDETPRQAYEKGFLPGTDDLSRFYLTRSVRIDLHKFAPTSRYRSLSRKCSHISASLRPRDEIHLIDTWSHLAAKYFTSQSNSVEYRQSRFKQILDSPFFTHAMELTEGTRPVGLTLMFLGDGLAHFGIPIYDPEYRSMSIGIHMLASILSETSARGYDYCYVGSCYTRGDLYKARFRGMEFFNGYTWSDSIKELEFLVDRQNDRKEGHLLSTASYVSSYGDEDIDGMVRVHGRVRLGRD